MTRAVTSRGSGDTQQHKQHHSLHPHPQQQRLRQNQRLVVSLFLLGCFAVALAQLRLSSLANFALPILHQLPPSLLPPDGSDSSAVAFQERGETNDYLGDVATDHFQLPYQKNVPESFRRHKFPRWGMPLSPSDPQNINNQEEGIHLPSILELLDDLLRRPQQVENWFHRTHVYFWGASSSTSADDSGNENESNNSSINISSIRGIWVSEGMRARSLRGSRNQGPRVKKVEMELQRAWNYLERRRNDPKARERWPLLMRTARQGGDAGAKRRSRNGDGIDDDKDSSQETFAGFPLIFSHADLAPCNHHNYQGNQSVPVFTTCAPVHCNHSFPFPNYATIQDSRPTSMDWDAAFQRQAVSHSWERKLRQIVWRGTLNGQGNTLMNPSPRVQLGMWAWERRNCTLHDVGVYKVPPHKNYSEDILSRILTKPRIPFEDFSNYRAILDIDGNAWSSRFGKLLCTNSIVVKVEPDFVDYFYNYLEPWKHYIPVRHDLSDLMDKVEWVLDSSNEKSVREIVRQANWWCRAHMTRPRIIVDMLDVLHLYVSLLDRGDPGWPLVWARAKAKIWDDPGSGWKMRKLP